MGPQETKERTRLAENEFSSRSFCLAKWYHSNINLQLGQTHSCYHPAPHSISKSEVKTNPSALHNTAEKLKERQEMLSGKRPSGCQYCWNIEDMGESFISDRHIRTSSLLSKERLEEVKKLKENRHQVPNYIEVSFGNECNFRCGYCHPKYSSRYYNEIKEFGPYSNVSNHRCDIDWFKIYQEDDNPYLEAWWKWWDQIQDQLGIFRVTGGEPLIQKSTARLLESLESNPKPTLELNINSNLGSAAGIVQRFCQRIDELVRNKKIRKFKLFTSMDTWGPQAEYIRNGLKLETFEKNLRHFLQATSSPVTFMVTFNIFSITHFQDFLKKILEWRKEFYWQDPEQFHRIRFTVSYLLEPIQYDIRLLPKGEYLPKMEEHLEFIKSKVKENCPYSFSELEYEDFRKIVEYMKSATLPELKLTEGRRDFIRFFREQDRRRGTDLYATFPEMASFFELCSKASDG